jgi:hypothetical protein
VLPGIELTGVAIPVPELVDVEGDGLDAPNNPDKLFLGPA